MDKIFNATIITPPDVNLTPAGDSDCSHSIGCTDAERIGYLWFYTPICLIGIISNIINVAVLMGTNFKLNGSTFTFLTGMAFADLITLSLAWPIGIMRCVPFTHTWQYYVRQIYEIYIFLPITNSTATCSVWMTVAVSIERYIFVGKSRLVSMSICSRLHAKKFMLLICICSFLVHVPYFLYRQVSSTPRKVYTDWAMSTGYSVYSWCRLFLVKLIPILLIILFNSMLVKCLWSVNKRRKSMVFPSTKSIQVRRQRMQVRTTAMLIAMSIIFLMCHTLEPFIHSGVYTSLFGPCSTYTDKYALLRVLVNTLEMISFATNFVVYCIFNKQFVAALCARCKCSGKNGDTELTTQANPVNTINY